MILPELLLRGALFLVVFAGIAWWEAARPARPRLISRRRRWPVNIGIALLSSLAVRLGFPVAAVGTAVVAEARGIGLWAWLEVPGWCAFAGSVLALDLAVYFQHRLFHSVPLLWRLHRMHHADTEFDVTTGARFHPFEIMLSMLVKMGLVLALGAPPAAVLVFELLLNATSMFNHANARLPARAEALTRWWLVTPDLHRVHHSVRTDETNSNFGFSVPWWDRLFGTYRAAPAAGHLDMTIGLPILRGAAECSVLALLTQPFRAASPPPGGTPA